MGEARGGGRLKPYQPTPPQAGQIPRVLQREVQGGAFNRAGREYVIMGRGLSGVVFEAFHCYQGFSGLEIGMFWSMSQSVRRNKNNGFQLGMS